MNGLLVQELNSCLEKTSSVSVWPLFEHYSWLTYNRLNTYFSALKSKVKLIGRILKQRRELKSCLTFYKAIQTQSNWQQVENYLQINYKLLCIHPKTSLATVDLSWSRNQITSPHRFKKKKHLLIFKVCSLLTIYNCPDLKLLISSFPALDPTANSS